MPEVTEAVELFRRKAADEDIKFSVALTQLDFEKDTALLELLVANKFDLVIGLDFTNQMNGVKKIGDTMIVALNGFAKGAQLTRVEILFDTETCRPFDYCAEHVAVIVNQIEASSECAKVVSDYLRKLDAIMNQVLAVSEVYLKRPFNEETNFGNLIADYMRRAASAEVALQNAGSFRADINAGDVTVGDVYNSLPFDNDIISLEVPGRILYEIINATCRRERGLLQISGASYSYDANKAGPSDSAETLIEFLVAGRPLEADRNYSVATNSFLASGQGGYPQLKNCRLLGAFDNLREVSMRCMREDKILNPKVEGRINRTGKK